jgi:hypothetical protein
MGRVVVAVARSVVAVGEDGQVALRMSSRDLGPCAHVVERLAARVKPETRGVFLAAAHALAARVAAAVAAMSWESVRDSAEVGAGGKLTLRIVLAPDLVLLVAAVALGVMRLGLACATTVLALFDRTALGVDMV